jgi:hypothetical protein
MIPFHSPTAALQAIPAHSAPAVSKPAPSPLTTRNARAIPAHRTHAPSNIAASLTTAPNSTRTTRAIPAHSTHTRITTPAEPRS